MEADIKKLLVLRERYLELASGTVNYDRFNLYAITHHSTVMEGSTLSMAETYNLLEKGLTPKNKPLEHSLMAVDHKKALRHVVEMASEQKELTVKGIQELSSIIMAGTGSKVSTMAGDFDSSKGDFRKMTVRAQNRTFMDQAKVPDRVAELVEYINSKLGECNEFYENSVLAFDAHFQMVSIHPFGDGNGRLSRLLMNYVQHYHGQPMTIVFPQQRTEYFGALEATRNKEDITIFRKFMFSQSAKYFKREIKMFQKKQNQVHSKGKGLSYIF